ncbi:MAG: hypothetical protein LBN00_10780 [Oscillospiraceae bacterium]|nr:hypothetical protein [Oscillospiraceae bacterium]
MVTTANEMNLLDYGFEELSEDELLAVDGGDTIAQMVNQAFTFIVDLNMAYRLSTGKGLIGTVAQPVYNLLVYYGIIR